MRQPIPSDSQILQDLRQRVADGTLHPENLIHHEGNGSRRDKIATWTFSILSGFARLMPRRLGYAVFARIYAFLGWAAFPVKRQVKARLELAFPDKIPQERSKIYGAFWRNFGRTNFEILDHERFNHSLLSRIDIQGAEHVQSARDCGKPIVFVHAHQTNWEIIFPVAKCLVDQDLCGLYATLAIPQIHRRVLHRRIEGGGFPYPRHFRGSLALVMRDLRAGHPLVIALDQRAPGANYPFFGQDAQTTLVPIRLAQRTGAHLIPVEMVRLGGTDRFRVTFHPNLLPDPVPEDLDLVSVLGSYNDLLEGWITKTPHDWFWLHNRWEKNSGWERASRA